MSDGEDVALWRANAETLVERIIEHGDDYGDLANTTGDDLRDALRVACERLTGESMATCPKCRCLVNSPCPECGAPMILVNERMAICDRNTFHCFKPSES